MSDNKIFRVGIYLRLSDEDRDKCGKDIDSESIKNQRHLLIEEINKRNNFILIDEYCDEDLSGAGTYRPEFERLIKDCEDGKLDVVMCKSQSRFSRDMEIVERYIHNKFLEWNIRFIGLVDNADTENSGNKKSRQINGLVNEWYLEDVSNNIRSAFKAKMKQGEYISPFAFYGYEVSKEDNNKLVVDKDASYVVKEIFNLYLSGYGYMKIVNYLNERNIDSPSLYKYRKGIKLNVVSNKNREDIKWSSSAIKSILTNEVYIGNLVQGKRTTVSYKNHRIRKKYRSEWIKVENTHDAIIDKELFNKVQMLIKERTRVVKNSNCVHIFSGKVFCLECGKYMRKKNSSKYNYLVCSSEYRDCSNNKSIRYDQLERIILDLINDKIKMFYDEDMIKRIDYGTTVYEKIKDLEKQKLIDEDKLRGLQNYLKCLYEDRVSGIISLEQFQLLVNNYNNDECKYKNRIDILDKEISYYRNIINKDKKLLDKEVGFRKLSRIMVQEFINKIYIGKIDEDNFNRDIKIEWDF